VTAPVHLGFDDKETVSRARAVLNDDILKDAPGKVGKRHEIRRSFDAIALRRVVDGRLVTRQGLVLKLVGPLLLDRLARLLDLFRMYPTDPGQRFPEPGPRAKDVLHNVVEILALALVGESQWVALGDEEVVLVVTIVLPKSEAMAVPGFRLDGKPELLVALLGFERLNALAARSVVGKVGDRHYSHPRRSQLGVVRTVLQDLLHLHVHPETQLVGSFEPVTCDSSPLDVMNAP
jgi:hypothetical protein